MVSGGWSSTVLSVLLLLLAQLIDVIRMGLINVLHFAKVPNPISQIVFEKGLETGFILSITDACVCVYVYVCGGVCVCAGRTR